MENQCIDLYYGVGCVTFFVYNIFTNDLLMGNSHTFCQGGCGGMQKMNVWVQAHVFI